MYVCVCIMTIIDRCVCVYICIDFFKEKRYLNVKSIYTSWESLLDCLYSDFV